MDKYRIRLENSRAYGRSVFWYIEEYSEKLGYYRTVEHGFVSFFGKKSAMRAAQRKLKKYKKFQNYNELYSVDGNLLDEPVPSYVVVKPEEDYKGKAHCVKCKENVKFTGKIKTSDSGRRIAMGTCPNCKTKVNRILPSVGSGK
jgi:hypothetical protein